MRSLDREIEKLNRPTSAYDVRRAFTLLEMLAVVVLLGMLAIAAAGAFRPETIGDLDGKVTAERIAWDLHHARRRAVSTGDNHALVFQSSGGAITSYTLHQRLPSTALVAVDDLRTIPSFVAVTASSPTPEFNFQGEALAGYTFTVTTPHRSWTVTVAQATGHVRVQ